MTCHVCMHLSVGVRCRYLSVQVACSAAAGRCADGIGADSLPQYSPDLPVHDLQCGHQLEAQQCPHRAADCLQLCGDQRCVILLHCSPKVVTCLIHHSGTPLLVISSEGLCSLHPVSTVLSSLRGCKRPSCTEGFESSGVVDQGHSHISGSQ